MDKEVINKENNYFSKGHFPLRYVLVAQSCPALCDPIGCSPPGYSGYGIIQARLLVLSSHSLLQGIFPNQGSNPGLLHCRQILNHLSHQGSPMKGV